jgi:septum formation protein
MVPIYLASKSPRRAELLAQMGVTFELVDGEVEEHQHDDESAESFVVRLARDKAAAGRRTARQIALDPRPVLGADTVVVVDGKVLGKPCDADDAASHLRMLSDRVHRVYSAVAIAGDGGILRHRLSQTRVWFRAIDPAEIERYWLSGEPQGKAGSYAIQGAGGAFVRRVEGSYTGVVGLPLYETGELIARCGIRRAAGFGS